MAKLWLKTLAEIGAESFESAYSKVMEESPFRPDIALIRQAAGCVAEVPVEREAREVFAKLAAVLRRHARPDHDRGGMMLSANTSFFPKDENGKPVQPIFKPVTEAAIADMGMGDRGRGFAALWAHPSIMTSEDKEDAGYAHRRGERILAEWVSAYKRAKMEVQR